MGWKNWPYWLKGGIIALAIYLVLLLLSLLLVGFQYEDGDSTVPLWSILALPALFILYPINLLIDTSSFVGTFFHAYLIIESIVGYFIIGAIIGWIVGKVKSRKAQS